MIDNRLMDAVNEALDSAERAKRERAGRSESVNIHGMQYELGADGDLATERDRKRLAAMAYSFANRAVKAGIEQHNRGVHATQRVDMREATEEEIQATYDQLLAEGKHRADTGQSGRYGVDLGDVVSRESTRPEELDPIKLAARVPRPGGGTYAESGDDAA